VLGHELETTDQHSFGREYDRTGFDLGVESEITFGHSSWA